MLPKKLQHKIETRKAVNAFRSLGKHTELVDFSSNDYLGLSANKSIFQEASKLLRENDLEINGATGSRLLSGNHSLYKIAEDAIAKFHSAESALIYNSGYDANVGFFSCIPQRGDIILYDELCHASIRDGIQMSHAKAYKFKHNDLLELEKELSVRAQSKTKNLEIYVVTESVFSMDGDQPNLKELNSICKKYKAHLVIDEAHAVGVIGEKGEGLVQTLKLENFVFARIVTFGKALGCHGAAILGGNELKNYLVNFSRSFIYTTALPPHSVATIVATYNFMKSDKFLNELKSLHLNKAILQLQVETNNLQEFFAISKSAIHYCVVSGNEAVKKVSTKLKKEGFDVKPILSPTVPEGKERLRICLHSFNTSKEIEKLVALLATFVT
jgi:8-amino-7-oxononanoate synthase